MILLIAICAGLSGFCLLHGHPVLGLVVLFGISSRVGWIALIVFSFSAFILGHVVMAMIPPLLILWNFIPFIFRYIKNRNDRPGGG